MILTVTQLFDICIFEWVKGKTPYFAVHTVFSGMTFKNSILNFWDRLANLWPSIFCQMTSPTIPDHWGVGSPTISGRPQVLHTCTEWRTGKIPLSFKEKTFGYSATARIGSTTIRMHASSEEFQNTSEIDNGMWPFMAWATSSMVKPAQY